MKKTPSLAIVLLLCLFFPVSVAHGGIIFQDPFDFENGGTGALNYGAFTHWRVSEGTVDLIGNGFWDFFPGTGLFVDMDGSTGNAGTLETRTAFFLTPGSYRLSVDIAGNQRFATAETIFLSLSLQDGGVGGVFFPDIHFASGHYMAPFTTSLHLFTIGAAAPYSIVIGGGGGDNIGALIDNVILEKISGAPEPSAWLLVTAGMAGLIAIRGMQRTHDKKRQG